MSVLVKKITPVSYHGKLVVRDGQIMGTKSGEVAVLSGMSFFWSNSTKYYYTAEMVDRMVDDFGCADRFLNKDHSITGSSYRIKGESYASMNPSIACYLIYEK